MLVVFAFFGVGGYFQITALVLTAPRLALLGPVLLGIMKTALLALV